VVLTKDRRFICLHDIHLERTTNVERVFPDQRRDDGRWYAADFSLEDIQSLQAQSGANNRFPLGRSSFRVPTLNEMIELVQGLNDLFGKSVGIYPELKAPAWHRENGLPIEKAFLEVMERYGYRGPSAAVFVQCFEAEPLIRMRTELGSALPQIMLIGGGPRAARMLSATGMKEVAEFANGIGPSKTLIENEPKIVSWAHGAGLKVHPYTFAADRVPTAYDGLNDELETFYLEHGVDGLFTDHPDQARRFLDGVRHDQAN